MTRTANAVIPISGTTSEDAQVSRFAEIENEIATEKQLAAEAAQEAKDAAASVNTAWGDKSGAALVDI